MMQFNDLELFDRYLKGNLNDKELSELNLRLNSDHEFRKSFNQHLALIASLKLYDRRKKLSSSLESVHNRMMKEKSIQRERKLTRTLKIHIPTIAVAASVTIIVLLSSIFVFNYIQSLKSREAEFIRLRREVAQIKMSQSQMVASLREDKKGKSTGSYTGTGFLINKQGYVLTCYHLVKDEDSLVLRNTMFGNLKAYLVKYDLASDIALLQIHDSSFKAPKQFPIVFREKDSMIGEKVFTLGYPKYDVVYSEGVVSSATGYGGDTTCYQISLPLNPGNSGGPLVNEAGYIIGLVNGKNITEEGSAFALKSHFIKKFLTEPIDSVTRVNLRSNHKLAIEGQYRTSIVKTLADYTFEVKVYE